MADAIAAAARQVRYTGAGHESTVHKLTRNDYDKAAGRLYRTRCKRVMAASEGAILTTRAVSCTWCQATKLTTLTGGLK